MKPYPTEELERMSKREIIRLYKRTVEQFNDAEPVRHGRWITDSYPMYDGDCLIERCTACGTAIEYGMGTPYCPFCGAKMDGETDGTD